MPDRWPTATVSRLRGAWHGQLLPPLAAISVVALAIGIVVGGGIPASSRGASRPAAANRTTVQRRDLIATETQPGTLGYADPRPVFNRISGTITSLPSVGNQIRPGQTLYQVDGSPVVLLDGAMPAYRAMSAAVSAGADVAELKRNLVALGFDPGHAITVDNNFDSATTDAVNRWQASLGETQTGQVTLGQVVFLPGPRRISAVNGVLGSTGGGAGGSAGGAGAGSSSGAGGTSGTGASAPASPAPALSPASGSGERRPRAVFASFTPSTTTATTTAPTTPTAPPPATPRPPATRRHQHSAAPTATQLLAELVAALRKLAAGAAGGSGRSGAGGAGGSGRSGAGGSLSPGSSGAAGRGSAGPGAVGGSAPTGGAGAGAGSSSSAASGAAATQIMQTTSSDLVVTVNLDATKQSEAVLGEPVTVQLPDGSTDGGKITAISSVAQSPPSSASGASGAGAASGTPTATVPVTLALTGPHHVAGLDQAAVSVNFQQQVQRHALSVPVTALLATAGGGYAVQALQGARRVLVPVTPGLFAAGYVQVSGPGLTEGMQVSNSQG